LSNAELAAHSHSLEKRLNHEKLKVWFHKKKVAQLQMTRPNLKDISHECLNRKDVVATQDRVISYYAPHSSIKHSKSDSKDRS
jgi:hypothetical protein